MTSADQNSRGTTLAAKINDVGPSIIQQQQILQVLAALGIGNTSNTQSGLQVKGMAANVINQHAGKGGRHNDPWVINNGTTDHITTELGLFTNVIHKPKLASIQIPNGEMVPVQAMGHVELNKQLVLDQVLGIPNFNFNLLFVSKLIKDLNCVLTFWLEFYIIQDLP